MSLSLGLFAFLNCFPLAQAAAVLLPDVEPVRARPSVLNRLVLDGRVTVGGISSVTYPRHREELLLVPGVAIASRGPVRSVLLVSRVPAEELGGRRVLLTDASATSHVLVKLVLGRRYGVRPVYSVARVRPDQPFEEADACLLIGDDALAVYASPPAGALIYDLGAEWERLTARPMVYAVWALRRSAAGAQGTELEDLVLRLQEAAELAQARRAEAATAAARLFPYSEGFLREYFLGLDYRPDAASWEGLRTFYRLAHEEGLLAGPPAEPVFRSVRPEARPGVAGKGQVVPA